jgi:hypothetical protein
MQSWFPHSMVRSFEVYLMDLWNHYICIICFRQFFRTNSLPSSEYFDYWVQNNWKFLGRSRLFFPEILQPFSCLVWLPNIIINYRGWGLVQLRPCFLRIFFVDINILLMTSLDGTGTVISTNSSYNIDTFFSASWNAFQCMTVLPTNFLL